MRGAGEAPAKNGSEPVATNMFVIPKADYQNVAQVTCRRSRVRDGNVPSCLRQE